MATITYSIWSKGWTSFWSYIPDWMVGLNSSFYSFNNGSLWKHNDSVVDRNNFYGSPYKSTITTVLNDEPMQMKVFKTLSLDTNKPWDVFIDSELNTGEMSSSSFQEKEDEWFSYIRRVDDTIDLKAISTQGIGNATSINSLTPSAVVLTFSFTLDGSISVGDNLYKNNSGTIVLIGTITGLAPTTITVDTTSGSTPFVSDFLMNVKNSQAESYGSRGFYMEVKLELPLIYNDTEVELFSIGSSIFKSFP